MAAGGRQQCTWRPLTQKSELMNKEEEVNDSHTDGLNKTRDSSPDNLQQPLNQDLTLTSPVVSHDSHTQHH